jgi:hypothetical protein
MFLKETKERQNMSGESQIVSELKQLKNVNAEIKRLNAAVKELRDRKRELESRVLTYLNKTNRQGAKTQDIVVLAKERVSRPTKARDEKEQAVTSILRQYGVTQPEQAYQNLLEAMKGEEQVKQSLVFKTAK